MGLEQRDQRIVHEFRLLAHVLDAEPGQRRRPIERLGDAGNFAQVFLAQHPDHARDLQRESRVDAGLALENDRRLAIDVGEVEIMIEAAPAQRVGKFARPVGRQDDARNRRWP